MRRLSFKSATRRRTFRATPVTCRHVWELPHRGKSAKRRGAEASKASCLPARQRLRRLSRRLRRRAVPRRGPPRPREGALPGRRRGKFTKLRRGCTPGIPHSREACATSHQPNLVRRLSAEATQAAPKSSTRFEWFRERANSIGVALAKDTACADAPPPSRARAMASRPHLHA